MTIEAIKQQLTLSMLLQHYGLKADKHARLKCPFHNDSTPSLQLYYKTQTAFCFSTNCKTHGKAIDVIDFIMYYENCTKAEAIQKAIAMIGGDVQSNTAKPTEERHQFLERMFIYFKNAVYNSKPAQEYLQKRNLNHKQMGIGYNAGQFHHGERKDETLIAQCLQYGLLLDLGLKARTGDTAYKPFGKGCICFALRNNKNEIVSFYYRSLYNDKEQRHFYLRDRQGLYPCYPKATTTKLIITESVIDAATLLQQTAIAETYAILALYGTNGFTQEHQNAIKQLQQLLEIIFFLNGDEPGMKAVAKYAPLLKSAYPNLKITTVEVPQDEDINSLLQGHSADILTHLIETRKEVGIIFSPEAATENKKEETKLFIDTAAETAACNTVQKNNEQRASLNAANPYNLQYQGNEALYQIKGFKVEQPDSLKVTLQIVLQ